MKHSENIIHRKLAALIFSLCSPITSFAFTSTIRLKLFPTNAINLHSALAFAPRSSLESSHRASFPLFQTINDDYSDSDELKKAEIITLNDDEELDEDDQEWVSDRDLIRRAANSPGGEALTNRDKDTLEKIKSAQDYPDPSMAYKNQKSNGDDVDESPELSILERSNSYEPDKTKAAASSKEEDVTPKKTVYTDEEEELINAMGGKDSGDDSKGSTLREPGYLGDSTLREIATDFSVPICYIADVLVTWGCPIPIDPNSILGDLVTGEQAFALLEAIHTLDISALHDRYSDDDIMTIALEYEIELKGAFDFAVKEGWSLPFGVRTHLRVEQEEELIRALGTDIVMGE